MKGLLALALAFASVAPAIGADPWYWVKAVDNASSSWQTEMGTADVKIKGSSFEAVLFSPMHSDQVRIKLSGTIKKGQLAVTETILETDAGPSPYTGTYKKLMWGVEFEHAVGEEIINLSDGQNMIGIRRNIAK